MNLPIQSSFSQATEPRSFPSAELPAFYDAAQDVLAVNYPTRWCTFGHHLTRNSLLRMGEIEQLVKTMSAAGQKSSCEIEDTIDGLNARDALSRLREIPSVIRLRDIDRFASYDALMRDALKQVKPHVKNVSGPMLRPEAALVIASPYKRAKIRLDPAYTIHIQISGSRSVTHCSETPMPIANAEEFEQFVGSGVACQAIEDSIEAQSTIRHVAPGEALFAPAFVPYREQAHDEVSVSLALSWRSRWSIQYEGACRLNARLRGKGAQPDPARIYPSGNLGKGLAWRGWQAWDKVNARLNPVKGGRE
ncbi:MAG: hypothetical protein AAGL10_08955 [Pseudomonadota bacterium]